MKNFDFKTVKKYEETIEVDGKSIKAIVEECAKTYDVQVEGSEIKQIKGSEIKISDDVEIKLDIKAEETYTVIKGYANNKDVADSYGDVPTGKHVYDLKRMRKNPVMLIDHENSAGRIMGNFTKLKEDEKGLYFESILKPVDAIADPFVKEVVLNYTTGFGRALSIGGRWMYDKEDPSKLIKAYLHEISGVAVGADALALVNSTAKPKGEADKNSKGESPDELESLVGKYAENGDEKVLEQIEQQVS